ncbi:carboxypeptidase-like regulatory domain-containing protein [Maribacter sp. ACAM166]|uniref:carboxypeptidase-like regulatory domain-containing protein n=1 Tax=Maribacter sp. ACAM166 TaxID=2508996 RepID=UPI0010FDA241|nr:carboxypeptidase-like regulatory domain-containing protein [Maribacter sp. ACAM166]TLP77600.1 hypothetical protein ES765_12595 [Maribacter sp. ACAM166]
MEIIGSVSDTYGQSFSGANIFVKGTSNGTQTDFDGNYSINTYKGAELVFTYIGFKARVIEVQDLSIIHVSLEEDYQALEEVVTIGYGGSLNRSQAVGVISKPYIR